MFGVRVKGLQNNAPQQTTTNEAQPEWNSQPNLAVPMWEQKAVSADDPQRCLWKLCEVLMTGI